MKQTKPQNDKQRGGIATEPKLKTGPIADRVRLSGDWGKNVQTALAKKRPKEGWPKA